MKRSRFLTALLVVLAILSLTACGKQEKKTGKTGPYEVRFNLEGGDRIQGALVQTVEKNESAIPPEVEKEGYVFVGWDNDYTNITEDTVIFAKWTPAIAILFDPDGGEVVSGNASQELAAGKMPVAPRVTRDGYRFIGWDKELVSAKEPMVYTAQWERVIPTAKEIFEKLSVSVVEIRTYDEVGQGIALGSGFFIDRDGTVLTNFHVMEAAYSARIYTSDGIDYMVSRVEGYDKNIDFCVIKTLAKDTVPVTFYEGEAKTGETVYTLGSSKGLTGTFSNGIVSAAGRERDGVACIQITAPISGGNSGGPLVNEFGEVLGVNTFQYKEGQNLNFAVAITELSKIDRSESITIKRFGELTSIDYSPHYTVVRTGDEGEKVYEIASSIEYESNDNLNTANRLQNDYWTAGYVKGEDVDVFRISVDKAGWITVYLMAYWHDDDDYLYACFRDANGRVMATDTIGREALISISDYEDEWMAASFRVPAAGDYYIDVRVAPEYPYKVGCYYLVGYQQK